jgi:hypothetical protein
MSGARAMMETWRPGDHVRFAALVGALIGILNGGRRVSLSALRRHPCAFTDREVWRFGRAACLAAAKQAEASPRRIAEAARVLQAPKAERKS